MSHLKIIPLGGLEEIGKNCTVYEYDNEIIVVDMGLQFPGIDFPGIDYILPDISYLTKNRKKVRALIITHGHLDHIGAIPYLIKKIGNPPIYGSRLALGIIKARLEEFHMEKEVRLKTVDFKSVIRLKNFHISFFYVNHNIPDSSALVIKTHDGTIFHTGDFKIDLAPVDQKPIDLAALEWLGKQKIRVLLADSTNSIKPGRTPTETEIKRNMEKIFIQAKGRIIFTTFSTLITRVQELIDTAQKFNRKIILFGRSLEQTTAIAKNLGYLKIPQKLFLYPSQAKSYQDKQVLIIATGSQGQENSALGRMSLGKHKFKIKVGDTIVFSSSTIPGNEKVIMSTVNGLIDRGAYVIYNPEFGIHASGHANVEDLKQMIELLRPQTFIPIHGNLYQRFAHKQLAEEVGMKSDNVLLLHDGDVVSVTDKDAKVQEKIEIENILVDGLGVGDVKNVVLRDRKTLADSGIVVVIISIKQKTNELINLEIVSRGFVFVNESQGLLKDLRENIRIFFKSYVSKMGTLIDWQPLQNKLREQIGEWLYQETERRPLIVPVILRM